MHACLLGDWLAADARQPHVERRRISEWKREPWWEHHVGARLQCQTLGMCGWQRARQIRNGPMDGWMDGSTTGYGSAASWSQCTCAVGGRVYIFDEKVFFGVHRERNSDRISAKFVKNRSSCNFKFKKTKFAFLDRISVISRRNSVISHRETYLPNGKVKKLAWLRNIQRNIYIDILQ